MTQDQEKKLDQIHELLAGSLEKEGLVHKVGEMGFSIKELKEYKEKDERFKAKVAGGIAVGTPALIAAWHWIVDKVIGH